MSATRARRKGKDSRVWNFPWTAGGPKFKFLFYFFLIHWSLAPPSQFTLGYIERVGPPPRVVIHAPLPRGPPSSIVLRERRLVDLERKADLAVVHVVGVDLEAGVERSSLGELASIPHVEDAVAVDLAPDGCVAVELVVGTHRELVAVGREGAGNVEVARHGLGVSGSDVVALEAVCHGSHGKVAALVACAERGVAHGAVVGIVGGGGADLEVASLDDARGDEVGALNRGADNGVVLAVLGRDLGGGHVLDGLASLELARDGERRAGDDLVVASLQLKGGGEGGSGNGGKG